jgi:hypothetical protein
VARKLLAAVAVTAGLATSPAALAADRDFYVTPTAGLNFDCTKGNPCSLAAAASQGLETDRILMAPGSYSLGFNLTLYASLMPEVAGTRPTISSTGGVYMSVVGANAVVRDFRFETSNLGSTIYALNIQSGSARVERVEVIASGESSPFAAGVNNGGTIVDSVLAASATTGGATAIATGTTGANLRNVTAVATGPNSYGHFTTPSYMASGDVQVVDIENSIVRGEQNSFYFYADATHPITVNLDHVNHTGVNSVGDPAVLNETGPPQTASPLFVGSGDFHQLAISVTRDAGAAVVGLSATDLDGQPRNQGSAPDIGADEFNIPPPVTTDPPSTDPFQPKAKKCKKQRKGKKRAAPSAKKKKCKKKGQKK